MITARQVLRTLEPLVFGYRKISLFIISVATLALLVCAVFLFLYNTSTDFQKGLPSDHEYIENFNEYRSQFGSGDILLVAVENTNGDIYSKEYLETLNAVNERLRALPGINRSRYKSLFSEDTKYLEIVEGGFDPHRVLKSNWAQNPQAIEELRENVNKAQIKGRLVAINDQAAMLFTELYSENPLFIDDSADTDSTDNNTGSLSNGASASSSAGVAADKFAKSSTINPNCTNKLPSGLNLQEKFPAGEPLNYVALAELLEQQIRQACETETIKIRIIGAVKVVGEIVESFSDIVMFFGIALILTAILLWIYCGSAKLAVLPLVCSVIAVIWELGFLYVLGFSLDPFAVLIPFLTLAVGVSHGVQMVNCWAAEVGMHGHNGYDASLISFRRLAIPGTTALITDVIGFLAILFIPIAIVEEMAVNAALGVAAIIITNKWLMPILLSYTKLSKPKEFMQMQQQRESLFKPIFWALSIFTKRSAAIVVLIISGALFAVSLWESQKLQIGEFKPGASQLAEDSRYNQDSRAILELFGQSQDIFQIIIDARHPACIASAESPEAESSAECVAARQDPGCLRPAVMSRIDRLSNQLQNTPNVLSVLSMPVVGQTINSITNAGRLTEFGVHFDRDGLKLLAKMVQASTLLRNTTCDVMPIIVALKDHKADTLNRIVEEVDKFSEQEAQLIDERGIQVKADIKLASGNAGIATAVNQVVEKWEKPILLLVYAAIIMMCMLSFKSIASSLCVLLPLALVSMMTYAVMTWFEIGLTVATLPVAAFGVGLGVDYGIYIFSTMLDRIKAGSDLRQAYYETLQTTGRAVVFTGVALSVGVMTWLFSSLQFQADMGVILVFMFLANMVGAIVILPALASFLVNIERVRQKHDDLAKE